MKGEENKADERNQAKGRHGEVEHTLEVSLKKIKERSLDNPP